MRWSGAAVKHLRGVKQQHVQEMQDRLWGPMKGMPGERWFLKPLEGPKYAEWYFPSKYNVPEFKVGDYFEMQAERYRKKTHPAMAQFDKVTNRVYRDKDRIRAFLSRLDEESFRKEPAFQDLYAMYRLMDPKSPLSFQVPERIYRETPPMFGPGYPPTGSEEPGAERTESDEGRLFEKSTDELMFLMSLLKDNLGNLDYEKVDRRITMHASTPAEARAMAMDALREHEIPIPWSGAADVNLDFDETEVASETGLDIVDEGSSVRSLLEEDNLEATAGMEALGGLTEEDIYRESGYDVAAAAAAEEGEEREVNEFDLPSTGGFDAELTTVDDDGPVRAPSGPVRTLKHVRLTMSFGNSDFSLKRLKSRNAAYQQRRKHARSRFKEIMNPSNRDLEPPIPRRQRLFMEHRHRFVDPLFRRRRLKYMERLTTGKTKPKEKKYHGYYIVHPDNKKRWPSNLGSSYSTYSVVMLDIATILGAIGVSDALSECRENPEYEARGNIFNSDAEEDSTTCQEDDSGGSSWMPANITSSNSFKRAQDLCTEMGTKVSEAFEAIPVPVLDLTMPTEMPQHRVSKKKDIDCPFPETSSVDGPYGCVSYQLLGTDHNTKELAVCLHGLNGSKMLYADLAQVLSRSRMVLTYDMYGHGLSNAPPVAHCRGVDKCCCCKQRAAYDLDFFVDQLYFLMEHLKLIDRELTISLIGFSFGGAVAISFADK
ncbi:hypothetical protein FOL46_008185 [Perkinsus olseni]|uniref:AB hydrolase-1 domain-containing protein n=1 Tax=Perkinsus olseni TaxID=32597 RepID=A0A7J6L8W9_PEROL|nr:hypothetical protein FOL46_008185 [Perkinsus olseni]